MISRIKDRISRSGTNYDKAFIRTVLRICRELHCFPNEVFEIPIPQYLAIVENINEMDKIKMENNKKHGIK